MFGEERMNSDKVDVFTSRSYHGKRWDVQLFLVRLMFCSTWIMFDNKKIGRFQGKKNTAKTNKTFRLGINETFDPVKNYKKHF